MLLKSQKDLDSIIAQARMCGSRVFVGKIAYYERLNPSMYGNPKFRALIVNEAGDTLWAKTADNAMCAYGFLNDRDMLHAFTYHTTRKGNAIITYVDTIGF